MATHSSIVAWRIPWTEEPGGLQSMELKRVGHDWSDLAWTHFVEWNKQDSSLAHVSMILMFYICSQLVSLVEYISSLTSFSAQTLRSPQIYVCFNLYCFHFKGLQSEASQESNEFSCPPWYRKMLILILTSFRQKKHPRNSLKCKFQVPPAQNLLWYADLKLGDLI